MEYLFYTLAVICIIIFILGMINPKFAIYWRKEKTRLQVFTCYFVGFLIFGCIGATYQHNKKVVYAPSYIQNTATPALRSGK